MKLLHIIATPRERESNTLRIATSFLKCLHDKYVDLSVDTINLFMDDLPAVAGENIDTKYTLIARQPIDKRHKESWK
jgi:FMN-dependent NADH-azoreductase